MFPSILINLAWTWKPAATQESQEVRSVRSGWQAKSSGVDRPSLDAQSWVDSIEAQVLRDMTNWRGSKQREVRSEGRERESQAWIGSKRGKKWRWVSGRKRWF